MSSKPQLSPEERGFLSARAALDVLMIEFEGNLTYAIARLEHAEKTLPEKACEGARAAVNDALLPLASAFREYAGYIDAARAQMARHRKAMDAEQRGMVEDVRRARRSALRMAWMPLIVTTLLIASFCFGLTRWQLSQIAEHERARAGFAHMIEGISYRPDDADKAGYLLFVSDRRKATRCELKDGQVGICFD